MNKNRFVLLSLSLTLVIMFSLYKVNEQRKVQNNYNSIIAKVKITENTKISDLVMKYNNENIIGILNIASQDIIITQANDNIFYLSHALDNSYNILGSPFLDYRTKIDDKKIIIYGHNSKKYDTPFKVLEKYNDKSFYDNNRIVTLHTENGIHSYEIFSVSHFKNDYKYFDINISNYKEHLDYLKKNSLYETNVNPDGDIMLLQTCSNDEKDTFIVISAVKIN